MAESSSLGDQVATHRYEEHLDVEMKVRMHPRFKYATTGISGMGNVIQLAAHPSSKNKMDVLVFAPTKEDVFRKALEWLLKDRLKE